MYDATVKSPPPIIMIYLFSMSSLMFLNTGSTKVLLKSIDGELDTT